MTTDIDDMQQQLDRIENKLDAPMSLPAELGEALAVNSISFLRLYGKNGKLGLDPQLKVVQRVDGLDLEILSADGYLLWRAFLPFSDRRAFPL